MHELSTIKETPMNTEKKNKISDINDLEQINSFGAIFSNNLIINNNNQKIIVRCEDIKKCYIKKTRNLKNNYFFLFTISLSIYCFFTFTNIYLRLIFILSTLLSSLMLVIFKKYIYTFFLLTKIDFIEVQLNTNTKEDAKKIVSYIRSKRKNGKK